MTNGNRRCGQPGQIRPAAAEIDQIDCHFSPQAQINRCRLQLRSLGLTALAERLKSLRGTFEVRGQIGAGTEMNFAISKDPEG